MHSPLDRTTPPHLSPFPPFGLPSAQCVLLDNGIPLYVVEMGEQEVSRLDVMFTAGKAQQTHPLEAEITNLMLKEGTTTHTSAQIAQQLDYLGAWLQSSVSHHNSYLTLYSLNKHFERTLSLVEQMIKNPTFPTDKLTPLLMRRQQHYKVALERVQHLANNHFARYYFGENHPYGQVVELADFETLTSDMLHHYHAHYYTQEQCKLVLTGRVTLAMIGAVNRAFGAQMPTQKENTLLQLPPHTLPTEHQLRVPKEGAVQAAIQIALPVEDRSHPDFHALRLLNGLFGGYFGSRLMTTIRQEKGYTYGINSAIISMPGASYLKIATQTATHFCEPLLEEVAREAEKLRSCKVDAEELALVQNYMSGELARLFDGAFSIAEAYLSLLANNLPFDYYDKQLHAIQTTTPEKLQQLAQRYLDPARFYTVVVG